MDTWTRNLRVALRTMARRPGFALAAIATLALGIGASTAVFSVAYGVSLRSLPYPDPDRLIRVYEANPAEGQMRADVSEASFDAWRQGAPSVETMALYSDVRTRYLASDRDQPVSVISVSPALFDLLGARPVLGPGFDDEAAYTVASTAEVAILSHAAWHRLFGGRPDAIGELVTLEGFGDTDPFRVVGVLPEGFAFADADLWRPFLLADPMPRIVRGWRYDRVVARLRDDATPEQVRAELATVAADLGAEFPGQHGGWTVAVESLHASVAGAFGGAAWLLVAAVGVVLLVTCVNVGGLFVARAVGRERETAVRVALGASQRHLLRLWLAEGLLVGLPGAGLGLLLAVSGVTVLKAAAPPGIPRLDAVGIDLPTLAVALLATGLAVSALTLAPLGWATGPRLTQRLRTGSSGAGLDRQRRTTRSILMATQCAGATALVILAVLLTRSFIKLTAVDVGWEPAGVLSLNLSLPTPPGARLSTYRYVDWSRRLVRELEAAPGIERAAITTQVPLTQVTPWAIATGRGATNEVDRRWTGVMHSVGDNYFGVMGLRFEAGRGFGADDRFSEAQMMDGRPERGVAIISEATARTLWPGRSALGEPLWLPDGDQVRWREVVGVVEDMQFGELGEPSALHVFVPFSQWPSRRVSLVVKGAGDATGLVDAVRAVAARVQPGTRITQIASLEELMSHATAQPRFTSRLVAAFGSLALLLAAIGIHGTLAFLVGARTREIGIRIALGAQGRRVAAQVLRRGLAPALAGAVAGLAIAMALARTFQALLFDLEPLDPASFVTGGALLMLVALAAALGPARRATRVDPAVALRSE